MFLLQGRGRASYEDGRGVRRDELSRGARFARRPEFAFRIFLPFAARGDSSFGRRGVLSRVFYGGGGILRGKARRPHRISGFRRRRGLRREEQQNARDHRGASGEVSAAVLVRLRKIHQRRDEAKGGRETGGLFPHALGHFPNLVFRRRTAARQLRDPPHVRPQQGRGGYVHRSKRFENQDGCRRHGECRRGDRTAKVHELADSRGKDRRARLRSGDVLRARDSSRYGFDAGSPDGERGEGAGRHPAVLRFGTSSLGEPRSLQKPSRVGPDASGRTPVSALDRRLSRVDFRSRRRRVARGRKAGKRSTVFSNF